MLVLAAELFAAASGRLRRAACVGSLAALLVLCVALARDRDDAGEDADPARAGAARARAAPSPARPGELGRWGRGVSGALLAGLLAARPRRGGGAPALGRDRAGRRAVARARRRRARRTGSASRPLLVAAGVVLIVKAVVLPALLFVGRAPDARAAADRRGAPRARAARRAAAVALALVGARARARARRRAAPSTAVALVALGIAIAVARRAAIFQALGFLVAENGLYVAALAVPGGLPAVIELGALLRPRRGRGPSPRRSAPRSTSELGTGDTGLLGGLRD